jgi:ion channel-forming bestrophin family protein
MTLNWFAQAFRLKGSVALTVLPRSLLFGVFGLLVSLLHYFYPLLSLKVLGDLTTNVVFNLVLGLLLVFRTNSAYDRYWEGRKAWGQIVFNIRNLAREIKFGIAAPPAEEAEKQVALRLLTMFALATKQHLRQEPVLPEVSDLVAETPHLALEGSHNCPLEIALWLGDYLQRQFQQNHLDSVRLVASNAMLSNMVEGLTSCERILRTPIPVAYAIYLKRLILIYCVGLPFHLVNDIGWLTGISMMIVSFILFGVDQIGDDIENPFGHDANDLPLDSICDTVKTSVDQVVEFMPVGDRPFPLALHPEPFEQLELE